MKRIAVIVLALGGLLFLVKTSMGSGDFKVYLEASKLIIAGKNPYNTWIFVTEGNYALYFNSPLWAVILIPFSYLPNFVPNFIWLFANAWFLWRSWFLLNNYTNTPGALTPTRRTILLAGTILLSTRFMLYNFEMIQVTIFLLWGTLESLSMFKKRWWIAGGALLALVINIKILPVVFVPYLFYRGYPKGAAFTLLFSVGYLMLPAVVTGWAANLDLHRAWWGTINPANSEHMLETDLGLHSLTALIPTLLSKTDGILPLPRNLLNLDPQTASNILNLVRLGIILLTLCFLGRPFRHAPSALHELTEISYLFLVIPLIFPHQQKYAFLLAAPAQFCILYYLLNVFPPGKTGIRPVAVYTLTILFFISFALMTLTSDGIIGRDLNRITQHFKLITYGSLLLIPMLLMIPTRIVKANEKNANCQ